jgi:hypothetical protein
MVWQGVTTGEVDFPGGQKMKLAPQDWKDFVKWIYQHIDGPPVQSLDVTSGGEAITVQVYIPDNGRDSKDSPAA